MTTTTNILVLGPEGSGKTLLIKRLQYLASNHVDAEFGEIPSSVPTVGNDIVQLKLNNKEYTVREIGGAMAPIWKNYYKTADALIYVINKSNQFQISASYIMLLTMLSHNAVKGKRVLILLNKTDFSSTFSFQQLEQIFRLDDLRKICGCDRIQVVQCSCLNKEGFEAILHWTENIN